MRRTDATWHATPRLDVAVGPVPVPVPEELHVLGRRGVALPVDGAGPLGGSTCPDQVPRVVLPAVGPRDTLACADGVAHFAFPCLPTGSCSRVLGVAARHLLLFSKTQLTNVHNAHNDTKSTQVSHPVNMVQSHRATCQRLARYCISDSRVSH